MSDSERNAFSPRSMLARVHPLVFLVVILPTSIAFAMIPRLFGYPGGAPGLAAIFALFVFFRWDRWRRTVCRACGELSSACACPQGDS